MNFSMQLAVVVAVCLCLADSAPEGRLVRTKQQRPTRGFKNVEMMTARGFGKRDGPHTRTERDVGHQSTSSQRANRGTPIFKSSTIGIARDFGKRTPEFDNEDPVSYESHPRKKFNPKNSLMVAYDFGKRSNNDDSVEGEEEIRVTRGTFKPNSNILIARGYGKRTQMPENDRVYGSENWDMIESAPEREAQDANDEKILESIPLDWIVNEMLNNPDFARSVVRKFIDLNQDGMLSSDELLRNF